MNMKRARFWRNLLVFSALSSTATATIANAQEGTARVGGGPSPTPAGGTGLSGQPGAEGVMSLSPSPYMPLDPGYDYARPMPQTLPPAYDTLRNSRRDFLGPRFDVGTFLDDRVGVSDGEVNFNFLLPLITGSDNDVLFLDGRAAATYTGEGAASAGIGYRVYNPELNRINGISGWVDYDEGHSRSFQQAGISFESLGVWTDLRVNGYIPFGTESNVASRSVVGTPFFGGNSLLVNQRTVTESALYGADAEIGGPLPILGRYGFSGYVGGYWLDSQTDRAAAGPRVRFEANVTDSFRVGVLATNDAVFGTTASANFQMSLPDGRARRWFRPVEVQDRLLWTVNRSYRVQTHTNIDISPTPVLLAGGGGGAPGGPPVGSPSGANAGSPINVVFVDPDRIVNGTGTFENPFNSLQTFTNVASNSLIVVDGSASGRVVRVNGANGGLSLFSDQKLLSTSILAAGGVALNTNLGQITLPSLSGFGDSTPVSPILTSATGGNLVTLRGSNTEIAGLTFDGATSNIAVPNASGISGTNIVNFNIHHNTFRNYRDGVVLNNATGVGLFQANTLTGLSGTSNDGFRLTNSRPGTLDLFMDTFVPPSTTIAGSTPLPATANTISGNDGAGIRITTREQAQVNAHIVDNTIRNNGDGIVLDASANRSVIRGSIVNNLIDGNRGEDRNLNGILDPGEDLDGDGLLTRGRGIALNANAATLELGSLGEDLNANGRLDPSEDTNGNGLLDVTEDVNGNGVLDSGEDLNGNLVLDLGEDRNGNNVLDGSEDANGNGRLDGGYLIENNAIINNTGDGIAVTGTQNPIINMIFTANAIGDPLDRSTGNGGRGLSIAADSGSVTANIGFVRNEDVNFNGTLDTEDTNGNGVLDLLLGEDANGNGVLDTEDTNGNRTLDVAVPADSNAFVANQGGGILVDLSGTAVGNIAALNNQIIGVGGGSLTFQIAGPTTNTPFVVTNTSDQGLLLSDFNWNIAAANLEFNTSGLGSAVFGAVNNTDVVTGLTSVNGVGRPFAVADQATQLDLNFTNFSVLNGTLEATEDLNLDTILDPGEDLPTHFDFNVGVSGAGGTPPIVSGNNFIGSTVTATFSSGQVLSGTMQAVAGNATASQFVVSSAGNASGTGTGIELRASGAANFNNPAVVGNNIRFQGGAGLLAQATEDGQINNLLVQGNTITNNGSGTNGGGINLTTFNNVTSANITGSVLNNQLGDNIGPGISVTANSGSIDVREIRGNNLTGNTNAVFLGTRGTGINSGNVTARVTGNAMDNSTSDGFVAQADGGTITLNQFSGNSLTNSGGDGVQLESLNGGRIAILPTEDANRNGVLDLGEDTNGNGLLDLGMTNNSLNNNAANGLFVTGNNGNFDLGTVSNLSITRNISGVGGIVIDVTDSVLTGSFLGNSIIGDPTNNTNTGVGLSLTATNGTFDISIGGPNAEDGNTFDRNSGAAISILAQNAAVGTFQIEGNTITSTADDANPATLFSGQGIYVGTRSTSSLAPAIARIENSAIRNNTIGHESNTALANVGGGVLVDFGGDTTLDNLQIANNLIGTNGPQVGAGVATTNNVVNGITFVRRNDAIINGVGISNNRIVNNIFDGIYLHALGGFTDQLDFTIQGNTISNNRFNGVSLRTEADSILNTTLTDNTIENNGANGILMTAFENSAADEEVQTGIWTKNTIRNNLGHGIEISTVSGNGPAQPLTIGQNGNDPLDGRSLGNLISGNGQGGIEINGPGDLEINNNVITLNGATANSPSAGADTNGTGGIDVNLPGTTGELRARLTNNLISENIGDGVELVVTTFEAGSFTLLGNTIDSNTGRGVDLLNTGFGVTNFRIGDGTVNGANAIINNGLEGVYVVNTASLTQSQQVASTVALLADGSINASPDMVLDIRGNRIAGNNNAGLFKGAGVVLRVGATNASFSFFGADDTGIGQDNGVGSNSGLFGNGRVNARIQDNTFEGNLGDDVLIESFASTVDTPTGTTWDANVFNPTNYRADPLARLNLVFSGNTGNSIDVTRIGAFYNNAEAVFKSRINTATPAGPFTSATRRRNAQTLPSRNGLPPFISPDGGLFEYPGMGSSTFRVESDFDISGFSSPFSDFNTGIIFGNNIFGEQFYSWDTALPGTFTFDDILFP